MASFDQFNPNQFVVEPIIIARLLEYRADRIREQERDAHGARPQGHGSGRCDGAGRRRGGTAPRRILLNADRSAPEIDSPEIDSREIYLPEIDSPEIDSRGVSGPEIDSPEIDSPEIDSETLKSLGLQVARDRQSGDRQSGDRQPGNRQPGNRQPRDRQRADLRLQVRGDEYGQHDRTVQRQVVDRAIRQSGCLQLPDHRAAQVRTAGGECRLPADDGPGEQSDRQRAERQSGRVRRSTAPRSTAPRRGRPASPLPPGVTFDVIVRARKVIASAPDPTVDDVAVAAQQEAVDTDDAAAGITKAPVITSFLSVATPVLPAGVTATPYSRQLEASGGQTPLVWNVAVRPAAAGTDTDRERFDFRHANDGGNLSVRRGGPGFIRTA